MLYEDVLVEWSCALDCLVQGTVKCGVCKDGIKHSIFGKDVELVYMSDT